MATNRHVLIAILAVLSANLIPGLAPSAAARLEPVLPWVATPAGCTMPIPTLEEVQQLMRDAGIPEHVSPVLGTPVPDEPYYSGVPGRRAHDTRNQPGHDGRDRA